MLNKIFESNLRVKISNRCTVACLVQLPKIIKTTHVNVFNYSILYCIYYKYN